jgi:uncharacterized DUF497 family protein
MTSTTVFFGRFEWDAERQVKMNTITVSISFCNIGVFELKRIVAIDESHSIAEPRYFCIGRIGRRFDRSFTRGKQYGLSVLILEKRKALYEEKNKEDCSR